MLRQGIPLGRLFGISVILHYSWFIIFALITWALATSYFPSTYPEWSLATHWAVGLATSLLFFSSVLAHELSHSIVAQAAGIPIDSITLFVFGGVSRMTKEPENPGTELRVALAGPVMSLLIGGVFWGIWLVASGFNEPLAALAIWLGWINVVLAVFNLIPGFPLDGGRVLRSILWWRRGNLRDATRTAANVGRGIGYLFIFGGIWMIFWGFLLNGLWIAFIGWFLQNAAAGSYRQVAIQDMLSGHTVSEVMTRDCPVIPPDTLVEQLVHDYILNTGRRCFSVVENGRALGLITLHDVKKVPPELRSSKTVGDAMTPFNRLRWVRPGDDLSSVLQLLAGDDVNQVPVVENNAIVGMVARDNLLAFIRVRGDLGM